MKNMNRRQFFRIGGCGLCGVTLSDLVRASATSIGNKGPRARQMIVFWLGGGPPHLDTFDMKPDAPSNRRSQFKPIKSSVPGLEVGELLPQLAARANKYTIIRSVSTLNKPGNHGEAPYYWLTGNPRRPTGTEEYPTYGSVVAKLRPGPADLPTFAGLGVLDWTTRNAVGNSLLGPAFAPFVFDPTRAKDAMTGMLSPRHELAAFDRDADFLSQIDQGLRRLDGKDELIEGLDRHQQTAFDILRSPKLRKAVDLSREPAKSLDRYRRLVPEKPRFDDGNPLYPLVARRLVEAGVPVVQFNFGYWDWHADHYMLARRMLPAFDAALATLLDDLDERGLLESTIVLALGEMGRLHVDGGGSGHNDYAQFVLAAGGGFRRGCVVGATDKVGERVSDRLYKIESFGRTLYHLLGIDPDTVITTPANRPIKLIAEDAPIIREAIV